MRPLRRAQSSASLSPAGSLRAVRARLAAVVAGVLLVAALAVGFAPAPASAQEDVAFGVDIRSCPSAAYPAAIGTFGAASCLREPTFNVSRSYDIVFDDGAFTYTYDIEAGEGGFGILLPAATYTVIVSDDVSGATVSTIVTFPPDGSGGILFTEYYALGSLPAANDDAYSVNEDQTLTVPAPGVLGNDQYLVGGESASKIAGPNEGSGTVNADGSLSYTPNPDFIGTDYIDYQILNGLGVQVSVATITITVNAVAAASPIARDDSYSVDEDTVLIIPAPGLLENDSVPGGNPYPYAIDDISDGTLVEGFDGSFTYTPSPNFNGTTTFPYQVDDADGQTSNVATVTITVTAVNDPPVANPDFYTTNEDMRLTVGVGRVLGNDTDVEGNGFSIIAYTRTANGQLFVDPFGALSYTPNPNFSGTDTFTYEIRDTLGGLSNSATVTITVNAVNDLPVANGQTLMTNEDTPLAITLAGTDVDGDPLTYAVATGPGQGTLSGTAPNLTYTPNANANGPDSFTFTASDGTATSTPETVTITVIAVNDLPTIADRADITAEATGPTGATVSYTLPVASDVEDGALTPVCVAASGSTFALGATTVTCTATDASSVSVSSQFIVTVVDTTPPRITVPADFTVEATSSAGATVSFPVTATDFVSGNRTVQCSPASGATFPLGPTLVTCSATDAAGNPASASFTVTVADTTDPVITVPTGPITVEATGPDGAAATFTATATDTVDPSVAVVCDPVSGSTFRLGETTVDCTATDDSGNTAEGSFTVEVVDTTDPVITVPDDITVEATGPGGEVVTFIATATDLVDPDVAVTCILPSGSTFPVGDTTVTCTATDGSGNTAEDTFTVTVADTAPPVITVPDDLTVEATSPAGASVPFTVTATDLVDGDVTVVCRIGETVITSPYVFPLGTRTVTCTATDDSGNLATATFTVTVEDTTGPSIRWIGGPQPGGIYTVANLPAAPTCEGIDLASPVTQCRVYGYQSGPGFWTMTARARDTEGNSSVSTRTYRVVSGGTVPGATPTPRPTQPTATPRPTQPGQPTATPTQPTQPTAAPTRPPRTPVSQPTQTPAPPTIVPPTATPTVPPVEPTATPTRPPRR